MDQNTRALAAAQLAAGLLATSDPYSFPASDDGQARMAVRLYKALRDSLDDEYPPSD
jgi:hypothetical protein